MRAQRDSDMRWIRWADGAISLACLVLGIVSIIRWHSVASSLGDVVITTGALQYNAALAFIAIGVAYALLSFRRPWFVTILAAFPIIIGLLTLTEYMTGWDLFIDTLFFHPKFPSDAVFPGRLSPNGAICSVLVGIVLCARAWPRRGFPGLVMVLPGSITFSLAVTALLGYVADITAAYAWGNVTRLPLGSALLFALIGVQDIAVGWRVGRDLRKTTMGSLAIPIACTIFAVCVAVWQALKSEEFTLLEQMVKVGASNTTIEIKEYMDDQVTDLARLSRLFSGGGPPSEEAFRTEAREFVGESNGVEAVVWLDQDHRIRWVVPATDSPFDRYDLAHWEGWQRSLGETNERQTAYFSPTYHMPDGDRLALLCMQLQSGSGYLVAVIDVSASLDKILARIGALGYRVAVFDHGDPIYGADALAQGVRRVGHSESTVVNLPGTAWVAEVWPARKMILGTRSYLPNVVLATGSLIALLTGFMGYLAQEAHRRQEHAEAANRRLEEEIARRRAIETELTVAKQHADEANRAKSEFLANMSHEIRTPLAAVLGYSELVLRSDIGEEQRGSHVRAIMRNGELLAALIDDILDLSKVEAGRLDIELVETNLSKVVGDVVQLLEQRALQKNITFSVRSEGGPVPRTIWTDPIRLRQILINIVGNAIKFTERGSVELVVRVIQPETSAARLEFSVTDTGIGVTEAQHAKLFQPFMQADNATTRRYGGTGLGLVLSRRLARALGGDLKLTWSEPGRGSTFVATVKLSATVSEPWIAQLADELPRLEASEAEHGYEPERLDGLRVLIVEDAPDIQLLVSSFVGAAGAEVGLASNGQEGVRQAREGRYDVVLMDIQMPVMNGFDAMRALRQEGYRGPIFALTAHALHEERERCLEAGFDDYIVKPVKRATIIRKLSQFRRQGAATSPTKRPSLSSVYEDDPIIGSLLGEFIARLPDRIAKIKAAFEADNLEEITRLSHQLKGAAGAYGYHGLGALAAEVEKRASAEKPDHDLLARSVAQLTAIQP